MWCRRKILKKFILDKRTCHNHLKEGVKRILSYTNIIERFINYVNILVLKIIKLIKFRNNYNIHQNIDNLLFIIII